MRNLLTNKCTGRILQIDDGGVVMAVRPGEGGGISVIV